MAASAKRGRGQAEASTMVIFGAAGDLTRRLLMPALYNLSRGKLLPADFKLVGMARADLTPEAFRKDQEEGIRQFSKKDFDEAAAKRLLDGMSYVRGNFDDPASYKRLVEHLRSLAHDGKPAAKQGGKAAKIEADEPADGFGNVLFYLATSPEYFAPVVEELQKVGLTREAEHAWRRVIVEKPFGTDLESAEELNARLLKVLEEPQIYRIDHYLGKETVQNVMVFRFANGIFEPLWNRDHIDHVQITVAETVGVENRGNFYDGTGALRDMLPNHMFQLLSFIGMEAPTSFDADALRSEKVKVLDSVRPFTTDQVTHDTVRGQYGPGMIGDKAVPGYRQEPKVAPDSETETYVAMKVSIDNWRWAGVPFFLRTGKRLPRRVSEVVIQFKKAPIALFRDTSAEDMMPNMLVLRIQPDEGISLQFGAKVPGAGLELGNVKMDFQYKDYFKTSPATGYETLIHDCMIGDATLFQRADNVEAGWRVVQPILDTWLERRARGFPNYESGSGGPAEGHQLLARDGRVWRRI